MAKNTTLSRKTASGLNKNEGFTAPTRRQDQSGDGADFAFNGQMGNGVNREDGHYNGRHAGNAFGETMRENYGSGPRSAKTLREPQDHGPSVTRDAFKQAPATASEAGVIGKGLPGKFKNPDQIYVGK